MSNNSVPPGANASVGERLDARLRLAGKLVSKSLKVQRTKALDALACAARRDSWRELITHLGNETDSSSADMRWMGELLMVLGEKPMGFSVGPQGPFSAAQLDTAEQFWIRVAKALDTSNAVTLDLVAAKLFGGAESWKALRAIPPGGPAASLYSFMVKSAAKGEFVASRLVTTLNTSIFLGEVNQFDDSEEQRRIRRARGYEGVLQRNPGFVEAAYELAKLIADSEPEKARTIMAQQLDMMDAMIPPDFAGTVKFRESETAYLEMKWFLYGLQVKAELYEEARATGSKSDRTLAKDNFGFRSCQPMLHLAIGDISHANRLLNKVKKHSELLDSVAFVMACEAYLHGRHDNFREHLFVALARSYDLRNYLETGNATPTAYGSVYCGQREWGTLFRITDKLFREVVGIRSAAVAFLSEAAVQDALRHIDSQLELGQVGVKTFNDMLEYGSYVHDAMSETTRHYAKQLAIIASPAMRENPVAIAGTAQTQAVSTPHSLSSAVPMKPTLSSKTWLTDSTPIALIKAGWTAD